MIYTGIGSRETPELVLIKMQATAWALAMGGYTLRSGGAEGADSAFERGCDSAKGLKEIYLPWRGFNDNSSPLYNIPNKAYEISQRYHPAWNRLAAPVKKLMARNAQQVLGENLDKPTAFVICWTPDGCTSHETRTQKTGGTGQAISIACAYNIPVLNMSDPSFVVRLRQLIAEQES